MESVPPTSHLAQRRRRHWALLGVLPALLLAGFGFHALRHEATLAHADARSQARSQAQTLADRIASQAFSLPLPSAADVEAWLARPGPPDSEPLRRISQLAPGVLAQLTYSRGTYPGPPQSPRPFEPPAAGSLLADRWQAAEVLERQKPSSTDAAFAWESVLIEAQGTANEPFARFRLATALSRTGQTTEARRLLESILESAPDDAGEAGLPIDVLTYRALLQIAEADPAATPARETWYNGLSQRLRMRWDLPLVLLGDPPPGSPHLALEWQRTAELHARTRQVFAAPSSFLHLSRPVADGVWQVLWPESTVHDTLQRLLPTLGLPPHFGIQVTIAGRTFPTNPPPDEILASATSTELPSVSVSLTLARPDLLQARQRRRTWIVASLIALAGVATLASYVAALRASERQRQLASQQADFVAAVSHELRAPLAAIRLLAEELVDLPDQAAPRRAEYHELILREARRLGLLIDNVLRHSRLERRGPELAPVLANLSDVARSTVATLQPSASERGIRLDLQLPELPVAALFDPQAVTQILVNLVDNALKHAPAGTAVEIAVLAPDAATAEPRARVSVRDHGAGIPARDHARIFEAFVRRGCELRRETPGVGLGLAIVKTLVHAHRGHVEIQSAPGKGACFTVAFPASLPR